MFNLDDLIRNFIINEGEVRTNPNIFSHIQAIADLLESVKVVSQKDQHKLLIIKQHLKQVKSLSKKIAFEANNDQK